MRAAEGVRLAGRYQLEAQLGRGGMGAVWRARDLALDRLVAIKVIDPVGTGRQRAQRGLRREAMAVGSLTHPQLARIYDYCEGSDGEFLVMELIEGESLATRLEREGRLPPTEAARIAALCAGALDTAHLNGLVHRDVKPSNIMLTRHSAKLIDFGIAATLEPSETTTAVGLFGTAAYLAPERVNGAAATPAADLYALGVVLYQMLAGHLPFNADETIAMLYAHTAASPIPLPPDIPPTLGEVCMSLLAKDPGQRPMSGSVVAARLDAASRTLQHTPQPAPRKPPLWCPEPVPSQRLAQLQSSARHQLRRSVWPAALVLVASISACSIWLGNGTTGSNQSPPSTTPATANVAAHTQPTATSTLRSIPVAAATSYPAPPSPAGSLHGNAGHKPKRHQTAS